MPPATFHNFGPYQAVARLEGLGTAELWHAWDPYLGRFVVVVSLVHLPAADVRAALQDVGAALRGWTGVPTYGPADVLHFSPGGEGEGAFVAVLPRQANGGGGGIAAAAFEPPVRPTPPMPWERMVLLALAVIAVPALLFWLAWSKEPEPRYAIPLPPSPTATIATCHTATPWPTETPTAVPPPAPRRQKPRAQAPAPKPAKVARVPAPIGDAAVEPTPELPRGPLLDAPVVGIRPGSVTAYGPGLMGTEQLVREWLLRHCHEVERAYQARGENFACGWMGVSMDGTPPDLTLRYTRIDRHMTTGRDLYIKKKIRLHCSGHCTALTEETDLAEVY